MCEGKKKYRVDRQLGKGKEPPSKMYVYGAGGRVAEVEWSGGGITTFYKMQLFPQLNRTTTNN